MPRGQELVRITIAGYSALVTQKKARRLVAAEPPSFEPDGEEREFYVPEEVSGREEWDGPGLTPYRHWRFRQEQSHDILDISDLREPLPVRAQRGCDAA